MGILNTVKNLFKKGEMQSEEVKVEHFTTHPSNFITPRKMKNIFESAEEGNIAEQHALFLDIEEQDSSILANIQTRKRAVLGLDWRIVPVKDPNASETKQFEAVQAFFEQFSQIEDLMMDCMDAVGHGFSALEIEWEFNGTQWLPKHFFHRNPSWFQLDKGDMLKLRSQDNPNGVALQPLGWIVHIHKSRSVAFARNGLFRTLAWLYMFKHYSIRDFAEFLELYGMPVIIGKYGAGATEKERKDLLRALVDIGHGSRGIMPESMDIQLHDVSRGSGNNPFLQMVDWCEKSIARLILGQTLTSGADGKSSTNALGNVHNEVRRDLLISDAKQLAQTFTEQIILPILQINFPNVDKNRLPRFEFDTRNKEDLASFADSLPKLVGVGMSIPEAWAKEKLGIPEVKDDEKVLGIPASPEQQALSCQCGCGNHRIALSKTTDPVKDETDDLLALFEQNTDWQTQLNPMVAQCVALLEKCGSYEEASQQLAELYPDLESNALFDFLNKGLFVSELLGKVK